MSSPLNDVYNILESLGFRSPCDRSKPEVITHKNQDTSMAVSLADDEILLTLKTPERKFYSAIPTEVISEAFSKTWLRRWVESKL